MGIDQSQARGWWSSCNLNIYKLLLQTSIQTELGLLIGYKQPFLECLYFLVCLILSQQLFVRQSGLIWLLQNLEVVVGFNCKVASKVLISWSPSWNIALWFCNKASICFSQLICTLGVAWVLVMDISFKPFQSRFISVSQFLPRRLGHHPWPHTKEAVCTVYHINFLYQPLFVSTPIFSHQYMLQGPLMCFLVLTEETTSPWLHWRSLIPLHPYPIPLLPSDHSR